MRDSFRHKVDFERFTEADLGGGSRKKTWNVIHAQVCCRLIERRGVELFTAGKKTVISDHRIFCRFLMDPFLEEKDRAKWLNPKTGKTHYFHIVRVKDIGEFQKELRIDCLEKDREA